MNDLAELLAIAPHRPAITSDVPSVFFARDTTRNIEPGMLLLLAITFRSQRPNGTWREFTRWLA